MRAVLYSRVSSEDQAETGFSLQDQADRMRAFCAARNIEVLDCFSDDVTGKIITRPGLQQVSALAEQRAFDVLVCVRLDRLARLNHLRSSYEAWLHKFGISVLYVEQSFEPTPAGRLQRGIMGELAEYESELIRERTTRGRIRKAADTGRMPVQCRTYGYHVITVAEAQVIPEYLNRSGELIIIEEQAAFVRRMFQLCAQGLSLERIAEVVQQEGAAPRMGGIWTGNNVRRMLRNETYIGRLYYNRVESVRTGGVARGGSLQRTHTTRDPADWILIPVPPIVDEALFRAAQARLDHNRERLKGRHSATFLLHGAVVCKKCIGRRGWNMACSGTKGWNNKDVHIYLYYRCTSRRRPDMIDCKTIEPAEPLEAAALEMLHHISSPGYLAKDARRTAMQQGKRSRPGDDVKRIEAALSALEGEENRIADLILAGVSHTVVSGKVDEIHRKRRQLAQDLSQARSLDEDSSPDAAAERGDRAGRYLREKLSEAKGDPQSLSRLIRLYLEIRIYRGEAPDIRVLNPRIE